MKIFYPAKISFVKIKNQCITMNKSNYFVENSKVTVFVTIEMLKLLVSS